MTGEKIKEVLRAQPFRPFRLHMGGGRALEVAHHDFLMLAPSGRTAVLYGPHDELEIIDVLMVQSIELITNGSRGRKPRRGNGRT